MDRAQREALIEEVMQAEMAWVDAHRQLDTKTLDRLMADDYFIIRPDGSVAGKEEDLASYQSGQRYWEYAEGDQYDIRLYGQTAVLHGRWRARGVNAGQNFDYSARFLSVYVKRDGRWQMVAAQSTPIPESA